MFYRKLTKVVQSLPASIAHEEENVLTNRGNLDVHTL